MPALSVRRMESSLDTVFVGVAERAESSYKPPIKP
jgi:hypothetical protein